MSRTQELAARLVRVRALLSVRGIAAALFATHGGFAWITGGGQNHVSVAAERGVAGVLVTHDRAYLLADNIEIARIREEELEGLDLEPVEFPWWSASIVGEALRLVPAEELIADMPVPGAWSLDAADGLSLRNPLLPLEIERYRALGEQVGVALTHVAFHCRPSLSEHQLAGMLAGTLADFGITPAVTLAAVDGRVFVRRHPIPTSRRLERYAMLVVGARRGGLNVSATRLVHFGSVPADLQMRHRACARVDAAFMARTTPGTPLAEVFRAGQAAYAAEGYPDEWRRHHQGGPTGYAERDVLVTPATRGAVQQHQAFAWNPSIAGAKSEDTVLTTPDGLEVLSLTPDLPQVEVQVDLTTGAARGRRPAILER